MKVIRGGSNVIASRGVKSNANFQIKASAQAFRILSSGLYSDKISAVLREIGCNAADAHVAAGTPDRPIEVKLPTKLDSSFYIKDWGTGLTHEEVTGLFTTYFSSNKGESNELTGAFGLGSKSPFSYTDSFMVTVAKDGMRRYYTAHIGNDGSPVITMLGDEEPSDEDWPNGMMVSFPVKPKDVEEFHAKAKKVYQWFRVKPVLLGGDRVSDPEYTLRGSNFRINRETVYQGQAYVIMGNVAYPLNKARLASEDRTVNALIEGQIALEVPIGSVMPTASREELEYDPYTRANLEAALQGVAKEIADTMLSISTRKGKSGWERAAAVHQYYQSLPTSVRNYIEDFVKLLGLPDNDTKTIVQVCRTNQCTLPKWVGRQRGLYTPGEGQQVGTGQTVRVHLYRPGERQGTVSRREVVAGHITCGSATQHAWVSYADDVKVVIVDAPYSTERLKDYILEREKGVAFIAVSGNKDDQPKVEEYAAEIAKAMGGIPVVRSSAYALPEWVREAKGKPRPKAQSKQKLPKKQVPYRDLTKGVGKVEGVQMATIPPTGHYYLVENARRRYCPYQTAASGNCEAFSRDALSNLLISCRELKALGIPLPTIDGAVAGTEVQLRRLKLDSTWKDVLEVLYKAFCSLEVIEALKNRVRKMPIFDLSRQMYGEPLLLRLARESHRRSKVWKALEPMVKKHPRLQAMVNEVIEAATVADDGTRMRKLLESMARLWPSLTKVLEQLDLVHESELEKILIDEYPLARFVEPREFMTEAARAPEDAAKYLDAILGPEPTAKGRRSGSVQKVAEGQLALKLVG